MPRPHDAPNPYDERYERYPSRDPPPRRPDQPDDRDRGLFHGMTQAEFEAMRGPRTREEYYALNPLADIVNDPNVTVTAKERQAINDPKKGMLPSGKIVPVDQIAGRSPLYPPIKEKRTRKKTKMDKTMSRCLKEANARYRNRNGKLKKGKTQSDVMRLAHRLCKKDGTKKGQVRKTARRAYEF